MLFHLKAALRSIFCQIYELYNHIILLLWYCYYQISFYFFPHSGSLSLPTKLQRRILKYVYVAHVLDYSF